MAAIRLRIAREIDKDRVPIEKSGARKTCAFLSKEEVRTFEMRRRPGYPPSFVLVVDGHGEDRAGLSCVGG